VTESGSFALLSSAVAKGTLDTATGVVRLSLVSHTRTPKEVLEMELRSGGRKLEGPRLCDIPATKSRDAMTIRRLYPSEER
jgi:hypothetical protein